MVELETFWCNCVSQNILHQRSILVLLEKILNDFKKPYHYVVSMLLCVFGKAQFR